MALFYRFLAGGKLLTNFPPRACKGTLALRLPAGRAGITEVIAEAERGIGVPLGEEGLRRG